MSTHIANTLAAAMMARILARSGNERQIEPEGEIEIVPECRVIRADGRVEVVTERKRLDAERERAEAQRRPPTFPASTTINVVPRQRALKRVNIAKIVKMHMDGATLKEIAPAVKLAPMTVWKRLQEYRAEHPDMPQPKRKAKKRKPRCDKRPEITAEKILELRAQGKKQNEIARELGCATCTISDRLRRAREAGDPALAEFVRERLTCPRCKKPKYPLSKLCADCRHREATLHPRTKYAISGPESLRPHQVRMIEAAAEGLDIPGIAAKLGKKANSVKTDIARVYTQLDVHSRRELVQWWMAHKTPAAASQASQVASEDAGAGVMPGKRLEGGNEH